MSSSIPREEIERIIDDLETKCELELDASTGYGIGNPKLSMHTGLAKGYKYAAEELRKIL